MTESNFIYVTTQDESIKVPISAQFSKLAKDMCDDTSDVSSRDVNHEIVHKVMYSNHIVMLLGECCDMSPKTYTTLSNLKKAELKSLARLADNLQCDELSSILDRLLQNSKVDLTDDVYFVTRANTPKFKESVMRCVLKEDFNNLPFDVLETILSNINSKFSADDKNKLLIKLSSLLNLDWTTDTYKNFTDHDFSLSCVYLKSAFTLWQIQNQFEKQNDKLNKDLKEYINSLPRISQQDKKRGLDLATLSTPKVPRRQQAAHDNVRGPCAARPQPYRAVTHG